MSYKMREQFEAFVRSKYGYTGVLTKDGYYRSSAINKLWNCWAESRAALCVELPKQWLDDELDCDLMEAHKVGKALDAAGVRYK